MQDNPVRSGRVRMAVYALLQRKQQLDTLVKLITWLYTSCEDGAFRNKLIEEMAAQVDDIHAYFADTIEQINELSGKPPA